jgi:hypothetical protein
VNWLDTIRVITAGIGLFYNGVILKRTIGDVLSIKENNLIRQSAITSVIVFFGGVVTQLTFLITGILASIFRPPIDASAVIFTLSSIVSGILARLIYVRRRELLVALYSDQQELDTFRKENGHTHRRSTDA